MNCQRAMILRITQVFKRKALCCNLLRCGVSELLGIAVFVLGLQSKELYGRVALGLGLRARDFGFQVLGWMTSEREPFWGSGWVIQKKMETTV